MIISNNDYLDENWFSYVLEIIYYLR